MLHRKFIFALLLAPTFLFSQNYTMLNSEARHQVAVGLSANPEMNASVDYLYNPTGAHRFSLAYIAGINVPVSTSFKFDFDAHAGIVCKLFPYEQWGAVCGLNWENNITSDLNGDYFTTGFGFDLFPGYYGKGWVVSPHLGLRYMPFIYIKPSTYALGAFNDLGSQAVYPGHDGWFTQNNLLSRVGINVGKKFKSGALQAVFGYQHIQNKLSLNALSDIGILPFYGSVSMAVALNKRK